MGYRKRFLFLSIFSIILTVGACATTDEAVVQEEVPPAAVLPDCVVEPLSEEGSEACTGHFVSPGDNSPNNLHVYSQFTGLGGADADGDGVIDGWALRVNFLTNIPGLVSGIFTVPLTQGENHNRIIVETNGDGCPTGIEGIGQNGDFDDGVQPEDWPALIFTEDTEDSFFELVHSVTGCDLEVFNTAELKECFTGDAEKNKAIIHLWYQMKGHVHQHMKAMVEAGDVVDEENAGMPVTYDKVVECGLAGLHQNFFIFGAGNVERLVIPFLL